MSKVTNAVAADNNVDRVDLLDRIEAMFQQESSGYRTENYMERPLTDNCENSGSNITADTSSDSDSPIGSLILSHMWREKICDWAYQVVDHFGFPREAVSIGMNFLDRYLTVTVKKLDKQNFQLLSMTCIYLAIKLSQPFHRSPKFLPIEFMIHLSRGKFTKEHVENAESHILNKLNWRVHPTTPLTFLRYYLQLLQQQSSALHDPQANNKRKHCHLEHKVLDLGSFFIELSIMDPFFLSYAASTVAMASLLNSMEKLPSYFSLEDGISLWKSLVTDSRLQCEDIVVCRERLMQLYLPNALKAQDMLHQQPVADDPRITRIVTPERHNKIRRTTSPVSAAEERSQCCC